MVEVVLQLVQGVAAISAIIGFVFLVHNGTGKDVIARTNKRHNY